ncbi:hypothetical protein GALL_458450 [mine drainage metagenome]|uniref:Uncharacterized protein n=1 Tax=mine drainage metagenome TaxID=410659 RepID=A0A1J5PLX9_9ZZZZ
MSSELLSLSAMIFTPPSDLRVTFWSPPLTTALPWPLWLGLVGRESPLPRPAVVLVGLEEEPLMPANREDVPLPEDDDRLVPVRPGATEGWEDSVVALLEE